LERVIETARLVLRRWRDGDDVVAAPIYAKAQVMRYIPGGTWDLDRTKAIVARMRALEEAQGYGFYPVVLKESGVIAGHAGLGRLEATPEVELAYIFDERHWGKGLATEAARGSWHTALPRSVWNASSRSPFPRTGVRSRSCDVAA
jgi:RimJ/RimL family protein N-acetyltransferase